MNLKLLDKKQEALDVFTFIFENPGGLNWKAGQFLRYNLKHPSPDNRKTSRYFTISSAPFEKNIFLTSRILPDKASSFKNALNNLPIGGEIEAFGPNGSFTLEEANQGCIFIAGGIGITPYRAILLDLAYRNQPINVTLLYANRSTENIVFKQELEKLLPYQPNFKIYYFIEPQRIDGPAIRKHVVDFQKRVFYVSGPEPMVETMKSNLLDMGLSDGTIMTDYFPGYEWP